MFASPQGATLGRRGAAAAGGEGEGGLERDEDTVEVRAVESEVESEATRTVVVDAAGGC